MLDIPTAIPYLRTDVSGARQPWDEVQTRSLAKRFGYAVPKTITFSQHTDDPVQRLINVVRKMDADAVVVPSLAHLDGAVPDALVRVVDVITVEPEATYARWVIPPDVAETEAQ